MKGKFKLKPKSGAPLLLFILIALSAASLSLGSASLSLSELWDGLRDPASPAYRILVYFRLPRVLAGIIAGASLAVSGALLQALLNNSLAGPNIIGVNAGAGLATMIAMVILPYSTAIMPAAAFVGAMGAAMLIYAVARASGASRTTLILSGVAISSVINAFSSMLKTIFPDIAISFVSFSVGSLANITMEQALSAGGYSLIALVCAMLLSHDINILTLGDEMASSLGLNVKGYRFTLIALAAMLAGSAVSLGGLIGFVGLLVPHIARMLFGSDYRIVLPASALIGAIALLLCDLIGRVLFAPFEVHVGVVLAIVGGVYFVGLILKRRGGRIDG